MEALVMKQTNAASHRSLGRPGFLPCLAQYKNVVFPLPEGPSTASTTAKQDSLIAVAFIGCVCSGVHWNREGLTQQIRQEYFSRMFDSPSLKKFSATRTLYTHEPTLHEVVIWYTLCAFNFVHNFIHISLLVMGWWWD